MERWQPIRSWWYVYMQSKLLLFFSNDGMIWSGWFGKLSNQQTTNGCNGNAFWNSFWTLPNGFSRIMNTLSIWSLIQLNELWLIKRFSMIHAGIHSWPPLQCNLPMHFLNLPNGCLIVRKAEIIFLSERSLKTKSFLYMNYWLFFRLCLSH